MKNIILAIALLCTPQLTLSDEQAGPATLEELLQGSDMKSMVDALYQQMDQVLQQMSTQLQIPESEKRVMDNFIADVSELISEDASWDEIKKPIFEIYQRHFDVNEEIDLTAFYESQSGKAMVRQMPDLLQDTVRLSEDMMEIIKPVLQQAQEFRQELKENR